MPDQSRNSVRRTKTRTNWWCSVGWALLFIAFTSTLHAQFSARTQSPIVDANTRFAFKLFNHLNTKTPDHNILVAPTGLSLTFGLLDNGSDLETRQEIESVFEFAGMELAQINDGSFALRKELKIVPLPPPKKVRKGEAPPVLRHDPNGTVVADSIWGHEVFNSTFLKTSQNSYGVQLKHIQASPSLSEQVSTWASMQVHTNVPIRMSPMARSDFVLVDVTRFHSFWEHHFDLSKTKPTPFTLLSGQQKNVPMMYQQRHFEYLEGPKFQGVILPYGQNASMYVLLPAEDSSLTELEKKLTAKNWQEWVAQFDSREGMVGFPKFKAETGFDVRAALQELGVTRIFERFSALRPAVTAPEGARLTGALQKTELSVDEQGTEAISFTISGGVIGGVAGGMPGLERPKPFVMIVNRPFFFAIRHNPTGQLLFLAAVVEP